MEGSHNTKYIENNLNSVIASIQLNSHLNYNNNDINPEKIKIIDTDKMNIMRKQKRISNNGEDMKIVFFD